MQLVRGKKKLRTQEPEYKPEAILLLWTELGPQNSFVEVLIASVTVFGDEASKEVIKIK